jgi:hypothetical protein
MTNIPTSLNEYVLKIRELRAAGKHKEAEDLKTTVFGIMYGRVNCQVCKIPATNKQQLDYKDIENRVLQAYPEFDVKIIKDAYTESKL